LVLWFGFLVFTGGVNSVQEGANQLWRHKFWYAGRFSAFAEILCARVKREMLWSVSGSGGSKGEITAASRSPSTACKLHDNREAFK
jgi:hypothetical protein